MERCRKSSTLSSGGRGFQVSSYGSFLAGYPWPPKSYTCCFCKRELKSAQALGGHMNVHRRDRAKLRESSSSRSCDTSNPNRINIPDLNIVPSASISSPLLPERFLKTPPVFDVQYKQLGHLLWKKKADDHLADDLDLELRLGYA